MTTEHCAYLSAKLNETTIADVAQALDEHGLTFISCHFALRLADDLAVSVERGQTLNHDDFLAQLGDSDSTPLSQWQGEWEDDIRYWMNIGALKSATGNYLAIRISRRNLEILEYSLETSRRSALTFFQSVFTALRGTHMALGHELTYAEYVDLESGASRSRTDLALAVGFGEALLPRAYRTAPYVTSSDNPHTVIDSNQLPVA